MTDNTETEIFEIVSMAEWKSKILNAVAWILGIRDENVYVITISDND